MAFGGDTATETLARVIEREPDWSRLPADTPPAIVRLLHRTLVKDPSGGCNRSATHGSSSKRAERTAETPRRRAAALEDHSLGARCTRPGGSSWTGAVAGRMTRPVPSHPTHRSAPRSRCPRARSSTAESAGVALSPDGGTLAFVARNGPTGRSCSPALGQTGDARPGSETAEGPFFSPDGRWVGFAVGVSRTAIHRPSCASPRSTPASPRQSPRRG